MGFSFNIGRDISRNSRSALSNMSQTNKNLHKSKKLRIALQVNQTGEYNVFEADGCINLANHLIELCELTYPRISSIQDINSNFLVAVFEGITGQTILDLLVSDNSITEIHNVQAVIDTLSFDVLGLSLSHISGEDIISGNPVAILNLLEVLENTVVELFPEKIKVLKTRKGVSSSSDDSNSFQSKNESARPSKLINSEEESIPPKLKRKLCRKTLKDSQNISDNDRKVLGSSNNDDTERQYYENIVGKSPLKRKHSKPVSGAVKRLHTEDVRQLHNLNFEKNVKALLLSSKSTLYSHQLKKKYLESLNTHMKRKSIPACKKSFLLPHNLRPKVATQKSTKKRKNSPSKKYLEPDIARKNKKHDNSSNSFIQSVLDEFPGFQFPKNTQSLLTKCYYHHVNHMVKQLKNALSKKPSTLTQAEKATKELDALSKILEKDIKEKNFFEEMKEHKMIENKIRFSLRDARIQSAKTRQYFDEFHKAMSKKLQKRNFSEEVLIERTFKEILDIQKEKVRQLCNRVKEIEEQDAKQHKQYLYALKNLYNDQLALLAESINAERRDSSEQTKAQNLALRKMSHEIRQRLQREVRSLQKDVLEMIKDIHFRELDAQTFISSFQQQNS